MIRRIAISVCAVFLLLSACQSVPDSVKTTVIEQKLSREFSSSNSQDIIRKLPNEVLMKTGSRTDIQYHIRPDIIKGSDVNRESIQTTKISGLRPFVLEESDLQQVKLGNDLVLANKFDKGMRGLISYTEKQQDVLDQIKNGYAPALSIQDLNEYKKIMITGNSNNNGEIVDAVQYFLSHNNDPTVIIPVVAELDKQDPEFTRFVKLRLNVVSNTTVTGTFQGFIGATTFSLKNAMFTEKFPKGLDIVTNDSRFKKSGDKDSGVTVTGSFGDVLFNQNENGDYESNNIDFSLAIVALQASQQNQPYKLEQSSLSYNDSDNKVTTASFAPLTIAVQDALTDIFIYVPNQLDKEINEATVNISNGVNTFVIKSSPDGAILQSLDYSLESGQDVIAASIQNNNLIITPQKTGNATLIVRATDVFGTSVSKRLNITVVSTPPVIQADDYIELFAGNTKALNITVTPADATLRWKTADENIAVFYPQSQQVYGVSPGTTSIIVTASNQYGDTVQRTITVKVNSVEVTGIRFTQDPITMKEGTSVNLYSYIQFIPENATRKVIQYWKLSDSARATIDPNGNIHGNIPGDVIVTAETENGLKATTTVTITGSSTGGGVIPEFEGKPLLRW
ncbi:Ig-like domain-containing protein [Ectobacillus panaciterrae]|uniref:Ig-like domain-containing protein n=1 Tax=Ectobacillus panaciterrae TaxID=363872 RepID=UPI0003FF7B16|nr:Ig-like domain-containing protein [Ectobacillus panaciterrae]